MRGPDSLETGLIEISMQDELVEVCTLEISLRSEKLPTLFPYNSLIIIS